MFIPQKDIGGNFPACPSVLTPSGWVLTDGDELIVWESGLDVGRWIPLGSRAVEIKTKHAGSLILSNISDHVWRDSESSIAYDWLPVSRSKKRRRSSIASSNRISTPASSTKLSNSRGCILPLSPLDITHRNLIEALGVRVCMHGDVGRVLVSSRTFFTGDIISFSPITSHKISTEDELSALVKPGDPPGSYLSYPRTDLVYYNLNFDPKDPIGSGDIWYLVNHSDQRPNCELKAHSRGLMIRAKRTIKENEPLTWTYNSGFFDSTDVKIDLPNLVILDESTIYGA